MATSNAGSYSCRKRALIIGNNNYSRLESKLRHCINDAHDLSELLKTISFTVTTCHDLTNEETVAVIRDFRNTIVDGDLVMVYFSGHGYQVNGRNYLMPIDDDKIETDEDVEDYAFEVEKTLERLASRNSSYVTIFILDCCRQYWPKKAAKTKGDMGRGLHMIDPPAGTFVQFACAANQTASDGLETDRNGVAADVFQESNRKQKPLGMNGLLRRGHIYLNEVTSIDQESKATTNRGSSTIGYNKKKLDRLDISAPIRSTLVHVNHVGTKDCFFNNDATYQKFGKLLTSMNLSAENKLYTRELVNTDDGLHKVLAKPAASVDDVNNQEQQQQQQQKISSSSPEIHSRSYRSLGQNDGARAPHRQASAELPAHNPPNGSRSQSFQGTFNPSIGRNPQPTPTILPKPSNRVSRNTHAVAQAPPTSSPPIQRSS
ncbi:unnamed protein product [Rotaria sordida]|uniref:Caspase family p20 domain-containing protein n=1 Tax=Rotaria sordida TaxID=392033 RepID=A0A814FCW4_9BILA|nr:unnamed protein product [Rotaria sordida]